MKLLLSPSEDKKVSKSRYYKVIWLLWVWKTDGVQELNQQRQTTSFPYFDTQRFKLTYFEIYPEKVSYLNTLRQLKSTEWTGSLNL